MDGMGKKFFISTFTSFIFIFFLLIFLAFSSFSLASIKVQDHKIEFAKVFKVHISFQESQGSIESNDYFVDKGIHSGLIPGYLVNVYRKFELFQKDKKRNLMFQDLWLPVGEARVIYSGKFVSIIRPYKIYSSLEGPSLFYKAIMLGDFLDLSSLRPFEAREIQGSDHQGAFTQSHLKRKARPLNDEKKWGEVQKPYGEFKKKFLSEDENVELKKISGESKGPISKKKSFLMNKGFHLKGGVSGLVDQQPVQSNSSSENLNQSSHQGSSRLPQSMRLLPDSLLGSFDDSFYEED